MATRKRRIVVHLSDKEYELLLDRHQKMKDWNAQQDKEQFLKVPTSPRIEDAAYAILVTALCEYKEGEE